MRLPVQIRQILFATDFSRYSDRARDYALTLARKHRAHVYVIHALEVLYYMNERDPELREWFKTIERAMERKMADEVALVPSTRFRVPGSQPIPFYPASCIPRVRVFRRQVPGTRSQVSGTGYLAPGT
jgi:nucleotide-binding universal stress UspA family protein